jgi:hypothetical protein
MSHVIVVEFVSLDGVMEDPSGSEGSPQGGWAFRYGPEAVANDPFGLGELLDAGALLLGRGTWQQFAGIWPGRGDRAAGGSGHGGGKAQAGAGRRGHGQRQRGPHADDS